MYAVGRNLQYYDAPAVRAIVRDAAKDNYTFASLVLGVVKSAPFQMRGSRRISNDMFITKKALPRRTFLRGMGATLALPHARFDGSGALRQVRQAARRAWDSSTSPTASFRSNGIPPRRARASSCRRS